MGRKTLEVKGYTPEDIKALFNTDDKYKVGMRLYAVYQVSLGKATRDLEDVYNTSFKQICNWVHRFEQEGVEGLKDKPGKGRKTRLSKEKLEELKNTILTTTPEKFGYNTSTWNGPILREYIRKVYEVEYKHAQIYNILKKLGFSYQKGRPHYPEADKTKREEFKSQLKKTPRRS